MKRILENDKALYGAPIGKPVHSGGFLNGPESLPVPVSTGTPSWHNGICKQQDSAQ